ncbi:phage/plasmid primase, P4 family [Trueperella bialowiezensis]|uniref:Phage/plasmid primase, P4 family, C-terminal domain n=1 Tax=Trueperella bialowiezensis TaxID=312285 RepID=A0A448PE74_9ACTO|nr:phage/plasmid primase, P4 family [Trueperella bialowiezensis]VEI13235.1 phage/plasmid primase, P4 family, C-terminal domain [Trueperella bialowiezensis]
MTSPIHDRALHLHSYGLAILPIHAHHPERGDKRPAINWKQLQTQHLTTAQVDQWFHSGDYGIAVAMGATSNGLMMIELEGNAASHLAELTQLAQDSGLEHLWRRLFGWWETTPSGGHHWYIYVPDNTHGNRKLARTADGKVLAETRENGGYSVVAPLDGAKFHHSGKGAWTVLQGGPETAGTFTVDELDDVLAVFRTLDQTPQREPARPRPVSALSEVDPHAGISPGDAFEAAHTWEDILTPHGWTPVAQRGSETYWRRPGKKHGISASTGRAADRDRLYAWTTSTMFEAEVPYTKFGAYALLEHGGDHSAAAKHLHGKGYGRQAEHVRDTTGLDAWITRKTTETQTETQTDTHTETETDSVAAPDAAPQPAATTPTTPPTLTIVEPDVYTRTDDGNALRFTDTYKHEFKYIEERNTWAHWDGSKWDIEGGNAAAIEAARTLARNLPTDDKADETHRRRSLSANAIRNMLSLARNTKGIYSHITQFDADPYTLNTPKGTINLHTGQHTPPDPAILCLRSTTVEPNWQQPTPRWNQFIDEIFMGDTHLVTYIQRFLGQAIIGETKEQLLPFFYGTGANGKTTLLNVVQHILGIGQTGYSTTSPAEILTVANRHPTEIAALSGVRLAVISELEEGQRIAEAKAKELTGGDNITARFMGRDFFTFKPTHTLAVLTNNTLETRGGGSPALWRRMRLIPFLYTVPKRDRDPYLEQALMDEAPGILAWLIQGTLDYLNDGLREPESVRIATSEYEADQNTVRQFVSEVCTIHEVNQDLFQVPVPRVRAAYERWCEANGYDPVNAIAFGRRMRKEGLDVKVSNSIRFYVGLSLPDDALEGALND